MQHYDWAIHKKLIDAGGLGDRVYIHLGRVEGKALRVKEMIEELQAQGREVIIATAIKKKPEPKLTLKDIQEMMVEFKALNRRDRLIDEYINSLMSDYICKPIVRPVVYISTSNTQSYTNMLIGQSALREGVSDLIRVLNGTISESDDTCQE